MSGHIWVQVLVVAAAFLIFCYLIYIIFSFFFHNLRNSRDEIVLSFQGKVNGLQKDEYERYLTGRFAYYDKLSPKLKAKFLHRVRNFLASKEFYGRDGVAVTDEMKVLVGASAVQLTFGLEKYHFNHFSKIFIYPEAYYSTVNDRFHKGETNIKGAIVFSWKDFNEGYNISNDAFNLGLHEMAHALSLEQVIKGDYDFYFANYFQKWSLLIVKEEFQNINNKRESFLRDYAGTNMEEFFAVCVEYFFEKGEEFKRRLPQIYSHLCALLRQDPLAEDGVVRDEEIPDLITMSGELQNFPPIFSSQFSFFHIASSLYLFVLVSGITLAGIYFGARDVIMLWFTILIGFLITVLFLRMNRFLVYDQYLVVTNAFGTVRKMYALSKIVSISFLSGRDSSVQVLIPMEGKMEMNTHTSYMHEDDVQKMTDLLNERNVLIRRD